MRVGAIDYFNLVKSFKKKLLKYPSKLCNLIYSDGFKKGLFISMKMVPTSELQASL